MAYVGGGESQVFAFADGVGGRTGGRRRGVGGVRGGGEGA